MLSHRGMSLPRQILPERFYMITRRCVLRMFLLTPDEVINDIFAYCLAEAAERFEIEIVLSSVMSNHHHTIVYDPKGRIVEFTEHLHRMTGKVVNVYRGRRENMWSSEPPNLLHLVDRADVIEKVVYAATNPVKAGLVARVADWPGLNSLAALLDGEARRVARPRHYFAASGTMPEHAMLKMTVPAPLGDAEVFRREVRERVAEVERQYATERARHGRRVVGAAAVRRQRWSDCPKSEPERGGLRPTIAARSLWSRLEALARNREFIHAYRVARKAWREGRAALFPPGTYWLHRFAGVAVAAVT